MNAMHQGVVTLLRSAITGEKLTLPEGFDLEAAYPELKRHHMDTLLYEGAVRCGIASQLPVMQTLFQKYCRALLVSEGQLRQLERIFAAFDEHGIDYLPLKGSKMKALYPKHELRYMGDADILIRVEQYDRIIPILESLEFEAVKETGHELIWRHRELLVELHKHLIPSRNKDFYSYFKIGWQMAKVQSGTRYSMSPEDEWIYLFTHFAKHFRDGGIGCRYVVDLWMYLRANPNMDQQYLQNILGKLQLLEFYDNILRLIQAWFEDGPRDEMVENISNFIFESGSWGQEKSRIVSRGVRESGNLTGTKGKLKYYWKVAFPSAAALREKYEMLQEKPWLLPWVWAYRPIYKLFVESRNADQRRDNLAALSMDNLDERRVFLRTIGLEYHF